jgi:Sulfatase/Bacterial Ig domain/Domain of unknown function (DUF4976)
VLAAKATNFIASTAEPFFLYWAPYASHTPWTPAPRHVGYYQNLSIEHSPNFNEADVSDKPAWVQKLPLITQDHIDTMDQQQRSAAESLLAVDEALKAMMDALTARGILDNTVIIFMSDNGFSWGSHRYKQKEREFEEIIRGPLLIRYPWTGSHVESRLVQNVDMAPTIAELAGVTLPAPVDGRSLVPLIKNTATNWRTSILYEGTGLNYWAVRRKTWKYVELDTGEKELYDLSADPYELTNVAGQPSYANIQSSLAAELANLKASSPSLIDFSLSNAGNKSVNQGKSITNTITATLVSGTTQAVSYSVSGLPSNATATFTPTACQPTCSTTLKIITSISTPMGTYNIVVTGTGGGITQTTSFNLTVKDGIKPTVTMTSPANGSTVSGIITVAADASDNVKVDRVQFKLDGVNLGTADTTSPYAISWDTKTTANGSHNLTAVARDSAGNSTTSSVVTVNVNNVPPTP